MDLFRPAGTVAKGPDPVAITPEEAGWGFSALRVIRLPVGGSRTIAHDGFEAAALPLSGSFSVEVGSRSFQLEGRADVFSQVSDFAYVPAGSEVHVSSKTGGELALPSARATRQLEPAYVPARAVAVEVRGGGVATRQINNFMSADAFEAERLIAVEVLTPEGNWSSFPPHKHDEHSDDEVPLEEIYYFRIGRAGSVEYASEGYGVHRTYTADGTIDATVTVRDGDAFLVPRGYHGPCVAAPGYPMYYLNVMASPAPGRVMAFVDDPEQSWIRETWKSQSADPRCPMTTAGGPTWAR
jgi:5-deoxy-glucuronate isomerase